MSVEQIVKSVKELEERFLDKDVETGDPALDQRPEDEPEYDEIEAFISLAQTSATNCMIAIEQMLRSSNKDRVLGMLGEDAESLLRQTQECLKAISEMFDASEALEDEEEEDEEEEGEEESPKEEPESEEGSEEEDK